MVSSGADVSRDLLRPGVCFLDSSGVGSVIIHCTDGGTLFCVLYISSQKQYEKSWCEVETGVCFWAATAAKAHIPLRPPESRARGRALSCSSSLCPFPGQQWGQLPCEHSLRMAAWRQAVDMQPEQRPAGRKRGHRKGNPQAQQL